MNVIVAIYEDAYWDSAWDEWFTCEEVEVE